MTSSERVAVVTGAGGGIGLAIAEQFADMGLRTVLAGRSASVLKAARSIQEHKKTQSEGFVIDLAHETAITGFLETVKTQYGRVDILVNNAGIHPKKEGGGKPTVEEISLEQWNEVMAVNLTAPFLLCRAVLPMMRERKWGRIINVSSRGGRTASPVAAAHYAASKAGMIGLTRIVALEAASSNITANCVTPGPVTTPMSMQTALAVRESFTKSIPLGRYGEPNEVASIVSFLASDGAAFMTGAILDVNGGTFMP
jgi:3-oxoacyl-[acyl-carrier protein] reductase